MRIRYYVFEWIGTETTRSYFAPFPKQILSCGNAVTDITAKRAELVRNFADAVIRDVRSGKIKTFLRGRESSWRSGGNFKDFSLHFTFCTSEWEADCLRKGKATEWSKPLPHKERKDEHCNNH